MLNLDEHFRLHFLLAYELFNYKSIYYISYKPLGFIPFSARCLHIIQVEMITYVFILYYKLHYPELLICPPRHVQTPVSVWHTIYLRIYLQCSQRTFVFSSQKEVL